MLTFIKVRVQGTRLARYVRRAILNRQFQHEGSYDGTTFIYSGAFDVVITPRCLRIFDKVNLYYKGTEVWLPLWSRLRLRNATRLFLIEQALYE